MARQYEQRLHCLDHFVQVYIHANYGAIYRSESLRKLCVAYNNVFRFLCSEPRNCSASHMFVSRGLPTCKVLIRKSVYGFNTFMISTKRSCNRILQTLYWNGQLVWTPALGLYL